MEHTKEVSLAANNLEERIICACHDVGKATASWQEYASSGFKSKSPHPHAVTGGLLASLLIKTLNRDSCKVWSIVALHSAGGHHSHIGVLPTNTGATQKIANDEQAKSFFLSDIATLLPEVTQKQLAKAWQELQNISPMSRISLRDYDYEISTCTESEKMQIFLLSRSLLGRLCYQDYQSAAKQSGNSATMKEWRNSFPNKEFTVRTAKTFTDDEKELNKLRTQLKKLFHQSLENDSYFYFIDAPTGLGKTETMLSGAEVLLKRYNAQRIIFTVPQVSIADQIYNDYFEGKAQSQIWNYVRQEKSCTTNSSDNCRDNNNLQISLDLEMQPFSEPYNVTTFNQLLLAMCHPLRTRCSRSIGLNNAIVIMDEFHKLPFPILPYFFRIAKEYAKIFNCHFILGSATPLGKFKYLGIEQTAAVTSDTANSIYQHPLINNRRHYQKIGKLTIEQIAERIEKFHDNNERCNLLVVLNLVVKGTVPLRDILGITYNPWEQLENLKNGGDDRVIIFLDGLVPPMLRRQIVLACKAVMNERSVTLITTQMVEVGVDLDFDYGIIDYQGIASTIQRGGRVGREGRDDDVECTVEIFSLLDENDKTSFQILCDSQIKNDVRMKDNSFVKEAKLITKFWTKEQRYFDDKIFTETLLYDTDLVAELEDIQNKIFKKVSDKGIIDNFFLPTEIANNIGIEFTVAQLLAELFFDNYGIEVLIIKDTYESDELWQIVEQLKYGTATTEQKRWFNKFIVNHKIRVPSLEIVKKFGLIKSGVVEISGELDLIRCFMVGGAIF